MLRIAVFLFLFLFKENNGYLVLPPNIDGHLVDSLIINGTSGENSVFSRRGIIRDDPPESFDWRSVYVISPVKNQLHCDACWAFSIIANIESQVSIYEARDETFSEQFLIDCDPAKKGCGDGSIIETYANIVTKLGGVLKDSDYYPYAQERKECRWKPDDSTSGSFSNFNAWSKLEPVIGFQRVVSNEDGMARFMYERGPLSAAINSASMAKYKGNYIDEPTDEECNPKDLNHAVLITGYSVYVTDSGRKVPYWIIKNSWGVDWGDKGFYYLVRGRNACGIASDVSIAYVGRF